MPLKDAVEVLALEYDEVVDHKRPMQERLTGDGVLYAVVFFTDLRESIIRSERTNTSRAASTYWP